MIVLAGGDLVLPDRILSAGSLLVDDGRIVAIDPRPRVEPAGAEIIDVRDCYIVPGFVDVHVHGVDGDDTLDGGDAIARLAPELPGALALVTELVAAGHRVSLGHSGASVDETMEAIDAGARHATHLFNRMTPLMHRAPGIAGAVLARDEVAAELICDGYHVHPAMCRVAIAAKSTAGIMAITDGTGGAGFFARPPAPPRRPRAPGAAEPPP